MSGTLNKESKIYYPEFGYLPVTAMVARNKLGRSVAARLARFRVDADSAAREDHLISFPAECIT